MRNQDERRADVTDVDLLYSNLPKSPKVIIITTATTTIRRISPEKQRAKQNKQTKNQSDKKKEIDF